MIKIVSQINVKDNMTILTLDSAPPSSWKNRVRIEGYAEEFDTDIVYDLPNSIGLAGNGSFAGRQIYF